MHYLNCIWLYFRVLISIRTEILDTIEYPTSEVEVEPIVPLIDNSFEKNEEFFLFANIFDVNLIDKRITDKTLQFELSIGNAGNSLDGNNESLKRPLDLGTAGHGMTIILLYNRRSGFLT